MIGIIVFSDKMIILTTLKQFLKKFARGKVIEVFKWHVMTQTGMGRIT